MLRSLASFVTSEDGATSFEYAIVVALVIVALIMFIRNVGTSTNNAMMRDANQLVPSSGS